MTTPPSSPISWSPSEYWDGIDGFWSTFELSVGYPPQVVRVLPSTAGQTTSVISTAGCPPSLGSGCTQSRGGVFDSLQSETWSNRGNYGLGYELNLGYSDNGTYGLDTTALGFSNTTGEPTLESHLVSEIETFDFPVGLFGLGRQQTNLSSYDDGYPSFLAVLKKRSLIPSLSWSYTAGARYRLKGVFGSLTFGGYDLSRFTPNNVSFSLATDISRDLVVGLQSIQVVSVGRNETITTDLLATPILTFVDSTLPYIYLPNATCEAFGRQFGLQYNSTLAYYTVTDEQHDYLMAADPSITFTIADSIAGGPSVEITLPYSSFDLELKPPYAPETTRYFPILPAHNESQYALGRTFLQEAYLSVNYESSNFSISQCVFEDGVTANILPFLPADTNSRVARSHKAIIGATVGAAILLLLSLTALYAVWFKRQVRKAEDKITPSIFPAPFSKTFSPIPSTPKEIGENSLVGFYHGHWEMDGKAAEGLARRSQSTSPQCGTRDSPPPKPPSTLAISRSKPSSPAINHPERVSGQGPRWNRRRQVFETLPPRRTSCKSLPPIPNEEDAATFQTCTEREKRVRRADGLTRDAIHEWIRIANEFKANGEIGNTGQSRTGTPF